MTQESPKAVPLPAQIERKEKSISEIKSLGLFGIDDLPVLSDLTKITPKPADDIAERAVASAITALKGEGMPHDQIQAIVSEWNIASFFTAEEHAFISNPQALAEDHEKFAWGYESLCVYLWALGYHHQLPDPATICDAQSDISIIVGNRGAMLAENANMRGIEEILDMADFYYRLNSAAAALRRNNETNIFINHGAVTTRNQALNWLIANTPETNFQMHP